MDKNSLQKTPRIAVLVPCYNEEKTIEKVVGDFKNSLPSAEIHVYDNNSSDKTVEVAYRAGAIIGKETLQGKGHVLRRMFSDVEADIYVLVDGDSTYDASAAASMIACLIEGSLDMVNGCRVTNIKAAYRPGHRFGNQLLTGLVASIFGRRTSDMLSGYRVLSRRFVKSFPALSRGFEIETELTVHALELGMPIADIEIQYTDRPPGSASKLNTIRDGWRILLQIMTLVKEERPLPFFGFISAGLAVISLAFGWSLFIEYQATGLVPRFPTAILAASMMIVALLFFFSGLILGTVTRGRREMKRLVYLGYAAPDRAWRECLLTIAGTRTGDREGRATAPASQ